MTPIILVIFRGMLSSAHVLAMDAKHLLDVVDDLRIKHPQCNERLLREQSLHSRYTNHVKNVRKKTWVPGPHLFGMQNQNIKILNILLDSQQSRQWLWILFLLFKSFFKCFKFGETITFISYINDIGYAKTYFLNNTSRLPDL